MSAKPKPNPDERTDLFIASHQERYTNALAEARNADATTQTEAWQSLYRKNMSAHQDTIRKCARSIKDACDLARSDDTSEDIEKDIKASVKEMQDERIRHAAWRGRAVEPYRATVDVCNTIIRTCKSAAQELENKQPLIERGLAEQVSKRIEQWPQVKWDQETGRVQVIEPGA